MSKKNTIRVGVIGATGYTGEELLVYLSRHPRVRVTYVSAQQDRRISISDIFPQLTGKLNLECRTFNFEDAKAKCDVVFLSLPHTVSMDLAPKFLSSRVKVIDVSADYRLQDVQLYEKYYKVAHKDPVHLKKAVYGLPELFRKKIKKASLVANPGCYPTGAILSLVPGIKRGIFFANRVYIDAKSGVSGAGRKADKALIYPEVNESFKAYKLFEHQHVPEINQGIYMGSGRKADVVFVPHLLPVNRGILSTIYAPLKTKITTKQLIDAYQRFYKNEPFVKILKDGALPELKHVQHTNFCHIGMRVDEGKSLAVLVSVIDNLGKGAATQAIQNMNILFGLNEAEGLL